MYTVCASLPPIANSKSAIINIVEMIKHDVNPIPTINEYQAKSKMNDMVYIVPTAGARQSDQESTCALEKSAIKLVQCSEAISMNGEGYRKGCNSSLPNAVFCCVVYIGVLEAVRKGNLYLSKSLPSSIKESIHNKCAELKDDKYWR